MTSTSTPALAPCPFCGGTNLHIETRDVQPDDFHDAYVVCGECDAQGRRAMTLDGWLSSKDEARSEAIAAWNRRTAPAASTPALPLLPGPCNATFYPNGTTYLHKLGPGTAYFTTEQMLDYARAAIAPLEAEIAALRRDAERYQWLREEYGPAVLKEIFTNDARSWSAQPEELDAAIDAALAAQGEQRDIS